jgi:DNA helicase MCM8
MVNSICPSIYGHELVKAGLVLSLFGGSENVKNLFKEILIFLSFHFYFVQKTLDVTVRNDIHTLIVGDPGLGKSQLLRACTCVSPRGIYVCGTGSTTAGLTVF